MKDGLNLFYQAINEQISILMGDFYNGKIDITDSVTDVDLNLKDYLAVIVVTTNVLDIILKVHSDSDDAAKFYKHRFPSDDSPSPKSSKDWLKEFMNQTAGKVKRICIDLGLEAQHSIPFYLPGYVDYFFQSDDSYSKDFKLDDLELVISISARIKSDEGMQKINNFDMKSVLDKVNESQSSDEFDL